MRKHYILKIEYLNDEYGIELHDIIPFYVKKKNDIFIILSAKNRTRNNPAIIYELLRKAKIHSPKQIEKYITEGYFKPYKFSLFNIKGSIYLILSRLGYHSPQQIKKIIISDIIPDITFELCEIINNDKYVYNHNDFHNRLAYLIESI